MTKNDIRARFKASGNMPDFDKLIWQRLFETAAYDEARAVFTYVSAGNETGTAGIITRALSDGKTVAAPCVTGKRTMVFRRLGSDTAFVKGALGLFEPSGGDCETIESDGKTLIIVPGAGFDPETKKRVGRGGGFYDAWLGKNRFLAAVGVTYESRLCSFEAEPHDVAADCVITEKRVIL